MAGLVYYLVTLLGVLCELSRSSGMVSPLLCVCSEKSLVREEEIPIFVLLLFIYSCCQHAEVWNTMYKNIQYVHTSSEVVGSQAGS